MAFSIFRRPQSAYARVSGLRGSSVQELTSPAPTASPRSKHSLIVEVSSPLDVVETEYKSDYTQEASKTPEKERRFLFDVRPWNIGIGRYFRLYDPEDQASTLRGWRKAVTVAAIVAGVVLLTNIVLTIIAFVKFDTSDGVGIIYRGDCAVVKRWDTSLHLIINLLGTALLAASSFTMQCLSSPTRGEVDTAHAKRVSLEIGIASFFNLFHVRRWKVVVWVLLCLSTLPLHLLWNSTVFSTMSTNLFSMVIAEQSFLQGGQYTDLNDSANMYCNGDPPSLTDMVGSIYEGYSKGRYSSLTAAQCLNYYTTTLSGSRRNLIVLVQTPTTPVNATLCGFNGQLWNGSSLLGVGVDVTPNFDWVSYPDPYSMSYHDLKDLKDEVAARGTWTLGEFTVESCLSETGVTSECQLQFMSYILYIVVACNVVKFVCLCIAARYLWSLDEPVLATIGDAVSSFLEDPDKTTSRLCLMDFRDVRAKVWRKSQTDSQAYNPVYHRRPKARLYSATSLTRWWTTICLCTLYLVLGWSLWSLSMTRSVVGYDFDETMELKFGAVDPELILGLGGKSGGKLMVDVVVANSFQVALSTTYFLYNSLYTAQCGALEWASYMHGKRKSLRVTWPRGQQRSTYYLQLPYRYGIPLTILLILMHFLISQSIFLARLQYYDWQGQLTTMSITDVGFSPRATFTTCLVGTAMILTQIMHALRPIDNRIPMHGNDSAVMSAMCHPPQPDKGGSELWESKSEKTETKRINYGPITWGVTRYPNDLNDGISFSNDFTMDDAGHCGFSADVVEMPVAGSEYR